MQLPEVIWKHVEADVERTGLSATKILINILATRYKVPAADLPKPKKTGRPTKVKS
jgi:hypothetical protein